MDQGKKYNRLRGRNHVRDPAGVPARIADRIPEGIAKNGNCIV
jgi:hypothetical protein